MCKQEVHFKKRLKTFKPLGSANGDGAGEGINSRQRRNLQARKRRVSGKILACEQALLFGQVKQVSLARSREARFACPNGRACSQARKILKSGPLRVHFQLSGTKIRGFVQNTDITFIR